jgi:AcrR family transcriptional regulator
MSGLRARKRARLMERVQQVALDLFVDQGYGAVTVADVAEAAEVAERTVYRHFETKEGLVTHDADDLIVIDDIGQLTATRGPLDATRAALSRLAGRSSPELDERRRRQLQLLLHEPALAPGYARTLLTLGDQLGAALARAGGKPDEDLAAQTQGRAIVAALASALEAWHHTSEDQDLMAAMTAALDALQDLHSPTTIPSGTSNAVVAGTTARSRPRPEPAS